jgi:hypothetical protein
MRFDTRAWVVGAVLIGGCATTPVPEATTSEATAKLGEQYRECLFSAADKLVNTPVSADDITANAEAQCRDIYLAYADRVRSELSAGASSGAETQYAADRATAQLRQLQTENRRVLGERIGLQSLIGK